MIGSTVEGVGAVAGVLSAGAVITGTTLPPVAIGTGAAIGGATGIHHIASAITCIKSCNGNPCIGDILEKWE